MTSPADLITPEIPWNPGAWTPKRHALWLEFQAAGREDLMSRLVAWAWAEHVKGKCHATQLPEIREEAA